MMMIYTSVAGVEQRIQFIEQRLGISTNTPPPTPKAAILPEEAPMAPLLPPTPANATPIAYKRGQATTPHTVARLENAPPKPKVAFNHVLQSVFNDAKPPQTNIKSTASVKGLQLQPLIQKHANAHGVNPSLVQAVIKAESAYNPNAVSSVGAQGLMQLMPATARELGVTQPFNPDDNIKGGAKYLGRLLEKYNGNESLAVAAYNAGPGAVDKYHGIPPYKETQNYVKKVLQYQQELQ
jgi:soluble lytic murein transglycosylase-like protein